MGSARHSHVGTPAKSDATATPAATDVSGTTTRSAGHSPDSAVTVSSVSAPSSASASGSPAGHTSVILSDADIRRTIDRIAHQILESVGDSPVLLIGIPTRGVPLAQRLATRMRQFAAGDYPVGQLDITLYRDDLRNKPPQVLDETQLPTAGVDGVIVVLVDDVLYSGRTIRAAMDALRDHGRPAAIRLAVLVDRGHRQLPIRADYVGKNIPTAFGDDVAVHLAEVDGFDEVVVERA